MSRHAAVRHLLLLLLATVFAGGFACIAHAYGPRGFDTVVIDAGHGGYDRGGGPGQAIPEKPYTLDAAIRLERALRRRGFRTVMTRTDDVFVSLPERVAIANSYPSAVFISVHYNSAPREGARGYETYYYRSDSGGLAARLHHAQLSTLNTEDRHVRRRGFYVVRKPRIPAVLCEGGFLTNPEESRIVLNSSYRQQWAENIADALAAQRREGDPSYGDYRYQNQPSTTIEPETTYASVVPLDPGRSHRHSRGGHSSKSSRGHRSRGSSRRSSHSRGGSRSSSRSHGHGTSSSSSKTRHHRHR